MKYNVSARGLLKKNDKILFIEYQTSQELIYALPGGSQKVGEDLVSTLKREFREETNLEIEPQEIIIVREFILHSSEFEVWKNGIHQVEIIFRCIQKNIEDEAEAGEIQDEGMRGLKWLSLDEMKDLRIYPTKDLSKILENTGVSYLFTNE